MAHLNFDWQGYYIDLLLAAAAENSYILFDYIEGGLRVHNDGPAFCNVKRLFQSYYTDMTTAFADV